jgi:anti-sigma factor RsiW
MAVAAAALLAGVLTLGMLWPRSGGASAEDRLAEVVLASHVRSLQVDHITDVASSDQHKVKPWFRGKLDFSPRVVDLSSDGYALSGGRLDYLADRPVAALVYHRQQHVINLFTWPVKDDEERPVRSLSRQGFHIRSWQHSGMAYWAISDLNPQELDEFVRLLGEHSSATPP